MLIRVSGLCFVQLLQYFDDYGQSRQVVENISKCSIDNTYKFCTEVGERINENHSRRPQVIGERPRPKHQTVDIFRLGRFVIRTIMVSEILHKVALKESCITLLSHKISFNFRVLSYNNTGPCNYRVEQLTARFLMSQFVALVGLMLQAFTRSSTELCRILVFDFLPTEGKIPSK